MANECTIRLESLGNMVLQGTCECNCGGGSGGPQQPCECLKYPYTEFTGRAMADFAEMDRAVAVTAPGTPGSGDWTRNLQSWPNPMISGGDIYQSGAAFSPDGQWLALANSISIAQKEGDEDVLLYKWIDGGWVKQPWIEGLPFGKTRAVAFSPDSRYLAYGTEKEFFLCGRTEDGWERLPALEGVLPVGTVGISFSSDGTCMARIMSNNAEFNGNVVEIYKMTDGTWVKQAKPAETMGNPATTQYGTISPDGRWIAVSGSGQSDSFIVYRRDGDEWVKYTMPDASFLKTNCRGVAFSSDSKWMALGLKSGGVYVAGLVNGEWVRNTSPQLTNTIVTYGVSFEPGSHTLYVGGYSNILKRYTLEGNVWTEQQQIVVAGSTVIMGIVFSPRGNQMAVVYGGQGYPVALFERENPGSAAENQIHPYTSLRNAVEMEGFAGVGFVPGALAQDETGTMHVMFE